MEGGLITPTALIRTGATRGVTSAVSEHPFDKQEFLPKRGEVLIWHANLLHGGKPVQDRSSRRWSQVIHYFFSDCLYTTPLRSFAPNGGGAHSSVIPLIFPKTHPATAQQIG
jgi:hypothetical protein